MIYVKQPKIELEFRDLNIVVGYGTTESDVSVVIVATEDNELFSIDGTSANYQIGTVIEPQELSIITPGTKYKVV